MIQINEVFNLDKLVTAVKKNSYYVDGDYYDNDGILFCGMCSTQKECDVRFFGIVKRVPCLCDCKAAEMTKIEQQNKLDKLAQDNRAKGFADSQLAKWTFEVDDNNNHKITVAAQNYCKNFDYLKKQSKGLLLYGGVGTGKTFYAACIANKLIDNGYAVLMTNFNTIANDLQARFNGKSEYLDYINSFGLLVIDDLGAERQSEYMQEIVYSVVDMRYRSGKPLIITTNLTIDELKNPDNITNRRIYDRILERCFPIEVSGGSRRRKNVATDYESTKKLLGL